MPLVKLFDADDPIEAHLLKHMLEQRGIPVFITGEHLDSAAGELPAMGLIDVWVVDEYLDEAQDVLDDFLETLDSPSEFDDDEEDLMDADGYYNDDIEPSALQPAAEKPRNDDEDEENPSPGDADNPWNRVYRRK